MKYAKRLTASLLGLLLFVQLLTAVCAAASFTFEMTKAEADADSQRITLEGTISSGIRQELTVRVLRDGTVLYLNQFTSGEDGSFRQSIPVEDIREGEKLQVFFGRQRCDRA